MNDITADNALLGLHSLSSNLDRNYPFNPCVKLAEQHLLNPKSSGIRTTNNRSFSRYATWKSARLSVRPVGAVQSISRMRGGAQSQLMLGEDGNLWVVKFTNNPQHLKVLANEWIATRLAEKLGFCVPRTGVVDVDASLIESNPRLSMDYGAKGRAPCSSGLQFGSQYAGGLMPRFVVDFLPDRHLQQVINVRQFAGMLAFDKWTSNADGRQAVYRRTSKESRYSAVFIDQGSCFNAGEWTFTDTPLRGAFARNIVYSTVTGWESFEPWLSSIEELCPSVLWAVAATVPSEWYGADGFELEQLIGTLMSRRYRVRELISQFRQSDRNPFPNWKNETYSYISSGFAHSFPGHATLDLNQTISLPLAYRRK